MIVCMKFSMLGNYVGDIIHSESNDLAVRMTSLHKLYTVPFSHGQYAVVK